VTVLVDGRVFIGEGTGIQRVARGLLEGARAVGVEARVLDPVASPRMWEQVLLPAMAGRRTVLSLANTAPLLARHSVVLVHDLAPQREPAWFAPRMRWYARAVALAARRADHVLTPSEAVRGELIATFGLSPDGVTAVRPAVSISASDASVVGEVRERLGLTKPYAVLMGWADPRKDLATALAAHRLVRADVDHDLVLIGGGHPNLAPVEPPDDPSVRLLGRRSDEDVRAVLTGAAVLLHPSRYEGFGLPPLEAWACGTPALIADIPAAREATYGLAPALPEGDVEQWAEGLRCALTAGFDVPQPPPWTWTDAGRVLRDVLDLRSTS
jgi:glycosyltransferase involved in cell wall biosynthesis